VKRYLLAALFAAWAVPAFAGGKASAPTVPSLEIDVLDPNVDPTGHPKTLLVTQPDGRRTVEIPPTVLVHKLYFTGERSFRGPYIPGGPCIVVATHPKTGERVYVPVQMHPGYPTVRYTGCTIEYDYGPQSITIHFKHCGDPTVTYSQCGKLGYAAVQAAGQARSSLSTLYQHTELSTCWMKVKQGTKNVFTNATDKTVQVVTAVKQPIVKVLSAVPGAKLFTDSESGEAKLKETQLRGREVQDKIKEIQYLPTNR
jgi:hypothetical protein